MDPISDLLVRIKNAQRAGHKSVVVPFSKFKAEFVKLLEKRGYLGKVEKRGKKIKKYLELTLLYHDKIPVVSGVKRISKPSRRVYWSWDKIKPFSRGIIIISTSRGVMTGEGAKKAHLGGEVIAKIW